MIPDEEFVPSELGELGAEIDPQNLNSFQNCLWIFKLTRFTKGIRNLVKTRPKPIESL